MAIVGTVRIENVDHTHGACVCIDVCWCVLSKTSAREVCHQSSMCLWRWTAVWGSRWKVPNGRKVTVQGSVWCVLVCDDVVVACRWFTRLWWFAIMCSFRVDVFCAHVPNTHMLLRFLVAVGTAICVAVWISIHFWPPNHVALLRPCGCPLDVKIKSVSVGGVGFR